MATATPALDPVLTALEAAPLADEGDFDPDELADVRRRAEEIRNGRVQPIEGAEVQRTIAAMRPLAG